MVSVQVLFQPKKRLTKAKLRAKSIPASPKSMKKRKTGPFLSLLVMLANIFLSHCGVLYSIQTKHFEIEPSLLSFCGMLKKNLIFYKIVYKLFRFFLQILSISKLRLELRNKRRKKKQINKGN